MPYRRLPNTDQARLRALRAAIWENETHMEKNDFVLDYVLVDKAKTYLSNFEKALSQYQQALDSQVSANKLYQQETHVTRVYISHFIQVLNLAVIRNDIRKERKLFYGLKPDDNTVPDLTSEASIEMWGRSLIAGEQKRLNEGGVPMYNPGIAKVKVHYENFLDMKESQKIYQQSTARFLKAVSDKRAEGDAIILQIWNEVEKEYDSLPPYKRLLACQKFGIVYYYRRHEAKLTPEDDVKHGMQLGMNLC